MNLNFLNRIKGRYPSQVKSFRCSIGAILECNHKFQLNEQLNFFP